MDHCFDARFLHRSVVYWSLALVSMDLCFEARFLQRSVVYESLVPSRSNILLLMACEARPSPRVRSPTENTIGERFMAKEESAASVGTRPWTPEGRSLTLSISFML
ncbi:hypothetical protein AVEN_5886-1 [Araneus ventricosus]|uniref:Uncharacterized protein n=1 Tax=Araneus ventricosus TaxID=182803 RepID=A0A4Y2JT99_ARAVE|nr:hypothetical protein AVEN_5886-1 [Araneus ventricosus]